MSYQPLARKYRPQTFKDLVGQEVVARALENSINLGREPHAVLFTGVRGIGKTTTARIYAKALNCIQGPTPAPCGVCENCISISEGYHEDVLEIDGASNTSVDDVRKLIETISYTPQRSKFRVYIIDEVHMLSTSAFNALLKTLEEPPRHVVFIFATTEIQKIPETILSRCQTFYLKKIPALLMEKRLEEILTAEKIPFQKDVIKIIARQGRGSLRDALTVLDHVIALGSGTVNQEVAAIAVPASSMDHLAAILLALLRRSGAEILSCLQSFFERGAEVSDLTENLAMLARNAFIFKQAGKEAFHGGDLTDSEILHLSELAKSAQPLDLNRIFRFLVQCRKDLDGSEIDIFIFENYCLEWCYDPGLPQWKNTAEQPRASAPMPSMTSLLPLPSTTSAPASVAPPQSTVPHTAAPPVVEDDLKTFPKTWELGVERWKKVKPLQARKLEEVVALCFTEQLIELRVNPESFASRAMLGRDEQLKLKAAFKEVFNFSGELKISTDQKTPEQVDPLTILEKRAVSEAENRKKVEKELTELPMTQYIMKTFNAKIESIEIPDSPSP